MGLKPRGRGFGLGFQPCQGRGEPVRMVAQFVMEMGTQSAGIQFTCEVGSLVKMRKGRELESSGMAGRWRTRRGGSWLCLGIVGPWWRESNTHLAVAE